VWLGPLGSFVLPGQMYCVGAGGRMLYDWIDAAAGVALDPGAAPHYFPVRGGSVSGSLAVPVAGWGAAPLQASEGDINVAKQDLAWRVVVHQHVTVPGALLPPRDGAAGDAEGDAGGAGGSAYTLPLRVAEAVSVAQRSALETFLQFEPEMYEVHIVALDAGEGGEAGGVGAAGAHVSASSAAVTAPARAAGSAYREGMGAASARAHGGRTARRGLSGAAWVPSRGALSGGEAAPGAGRRYSITHTVLTADQADAVAMQTSVNGRRAELDLAWLAAVHGPQGSGGGPAPEAGAGAGAGDEGAPAGDDALPAAGEAPGAPDAPGDAGALLTPSMRELLRAAADSIVVKTNRVETPVRVVVPKESLAALRVAGHSGARPAATTLAVGLLAALAVAALA